MPKTKPARKQAAAPQPDEKPVVECAAPECSATFTPKRSTARYCGTTCRQRAARSRRAAEAAAAIDEVAETADAEHGLVRATRLQLEKSEALDSVDGQIALQLARKLTDPDHVSPGLAKELRATLAAATGAAPAPSAGGEQPDPDPDADLPDEVKRARARRDAARQAAGQA